MSRMGGEEERGEKGSISRRKRRPMLTAGVLLFLMGDRPVYLCHNPYAARSIHVCA